MSNELKLSRKTRQSIAIGQRVKSLRKRAGYSQDDIAAALGRARSTIAGVESGNHPPGRDLMSAIAKLFNVSMDYLERGVDVERPDRDTEVADRIDAARIINMWQTLDDRDRAAVLFMIESLAKKS